MYGKCLELLCILYVWTLYVRHCHIFENVLLYVVTDGPFGLVFINKLVSKLFSCPVQMFSFRQRQPEIYPYLVGSRRGLLFPGSFSEC